MLGFIASEFNFSIVKGRMCHFLFKKLQNLKLQWKGLNVYFCIVPVQYIRENTENDTGSFACFSLFTTIYNSALLITIFQSIL